MSSSPNIWRTLFPKMLEANRVLLTGGGSFSGCFLSFRVSSRLSAPSSPLCTEAPDLWLSVHIIPSLISVETLITCLLKEFCRSLPHAWLCFLLISTFIQNAASYEQPVLIPALPPKVVPAGLNIEVMGDGYECWQRRGGLRFSPAVQALSITPHPPNVLPWSLKCTSSHSVLKPHLHVNTGRNLGNPGSV